MEKTDRDGKTLQQFLADYDDSVWPHPSLTADVTVFSIDEEKPAVLLVRRAAHPYIGDWAFPGGYVNIDESTEQAAARELYEETGIAGLHLDQTYTVSTPGRDPRGWTVSVCYMAVMDRGAVEPKAGDDAAEARWFHIGYVRSGCDYVLKLTSGDIVLTAEITVKRDKMGNIDVNDSRIVKCDGIAFDHAKLLLQAIERL